MNLKADSFKQYLAKKGITYFRVEETTNDNSDNSDNKENHSRVTFHTYVKVFGQKLPAVVIMDDSIYTVIRVQIVPETSFIKNKDEFIRCVNEMNITYKAIKYYLGMDGALYLDMYIPSNKNETDGDLVIDLLGAINSHLEQEYPNWMKLLWS